MVGEEEDRREEELRRVRRRRSSSWRWRRRGGGNVFKSINRLSSHSRGGADNLDGMPKACSFSGRSKRLSAAHERADLPPM